MFLARVQGVVPWLDAAATATQGAPSMPSTLVSQGRMHMLSCLVVTAKHPPHCCTLALALRKSMRKCAIRCAATVVPTPGRSFLALNTVCRRVGLLE